MIRPTRRAIFLFVLGVPLALFLVIYDAALWPWPFDWSALVLVAVATDAALALPLRLFPVTARAPERIYLGEEGVVTVVIDAARTRRRRLVEALAEQEGALDPPVLVAAELAAGNTAIHLKLMPRRRGRIRVLRIWLRGRGPLGLAEIVRRVAVERTIDVVPNLRSVRAAALQFFAREAIYGVKVQHQRGEGTEFEALRDHVPGLDTRRIDWKHSARHRKLVAKEFRTERNHQIILAFDTGYLMSEPIDGIPRLDHAINAGLVLAWISLQGGDLVGTYAFDGVVRHYLQPVRGIAKLSRIQQTTAALEYRHEETNFTLGLAELTARLKRRALVILFTDFVDTVTAELLIESMQRVASRHVVVFVTLRDPLLQQISDAAPEDFARVAEAVVAQDFRRDRSIVFERLQRLGIHCLDIASERLSVGLINRYLTIKERGLI
jgi:uncharacterized protein (DUF58 family)